MYDRLLDDPLAAVAMHEKARQAGVRAHATLAGAIDGAQLVISAVTAASAAGVAQQAGGCMVEDQIFFDINSVSPQTKQHDQRCIETGKGDYIEAAVMAPVPPYGLKVPMLLGGARADEVAGWLNAAGFSVRAVASEIGVASAAKMCRSVMIKGIEALTVECLGAARRYGAETIVLDSLKETFGKMQGDANLPGYLISRVAEHGRRRAAEMREVSQTLHDVGIDPQMSDACARLQDGLVDAMQAHGVTYDAASPFVWQALLDALAPVEAKDP
jgi:3-hydroxyisobutyrate dehydrogenase-like beta-hydroxyacid dehydrogenase